MGGFFGKNISIIRAKFNGTGFIAELDTALAPYIKKGVTEGDGYNKLQANGCPCCRETYYEHYRYFFWLLSKERQ